LYPGLAVLVVPPTGLARLGPPAALLVPDHQLLELRLELFGAEGARVMLPLKFSVAAVYFMEVHLTPNIASLGLDVYV
jgi:hypothetical protein